MIANRNALWTRCLLPQEIVDHIIGFVDPADHNTILSCCLVTRSLFAPATRLLFSHLQITKDNLHAVLQQLQTSPLKTSAIEELIFSQFWLNRPPRLSIDVAPFVMLAQNLRKLVLRGSAWGKQSPELLHFANTSLVSLILWDTLFEHIWDALNLICSFPSLKKLCLDGVYFRKSGHELAQSQEHLLRLPRLTELDVRRTTYDIAPYLFPSEKVDHVATLRLQCHASGVEDWWRLLRAADIDLPTFPDLRELVLHEFVAGMSAFKNK